MSNSSISLTLNPITVETNYWLVERMSNTISLLWLEFQLIFLGVAGASGVVCAYGFSVLKIRMEDNCVLFSKLVFTPNPPFNHTYHINRWLSDWGDDVCDFILYEPIVTTIVACVFITMSIVCGRGGAGDLSGLPQPWRIVMPSLIANLVCLMCSLAAAITFSDGVYVFCNNLKPYKKNNSTTWCYPIRQLHIGNVNVGEDLFSYLGINQIALWVAFVFWSLSFCWIIVRCLCVVDFRLVRSTIYDFSGTMDQVINKDFIYKDEDDLQTTSSFVIEVLAEEAAKKLAA